MIKVAIKLVHASLAKLADFRVEKNTICIGADWEKLADRGVWCYVNRLVVLNGNNR